MNTSKNISWIYRNLNDWKIVKNKVYTVKMQIGDPDYVYNVPERPGVVYNYLENVYENVKSNNYVVTGLAGEMWVIDKKSSGKYDIRGELQNAPTSVSTKKTEEVYAAVRIPCDIQFTVEADYGEKVILEGNRHGINHGEGDYILVKAEKINGVYHPDFLSSGRIINGTIFDELYNEL